MKVLFTTLAAALLLSDGTARVTFREVAPAVSGITWVHNNAASDQHYLPETEPPGVAIFDYNNDGWMDIFFVNSGPAPFFHPSKPLRHALYRNNRDGTFTDVTAEAGITADLFGMGAAAGDYDGDGNIDLFITGYGKCVLYRNNGNGTFTDVTAQSGINPPGWSTSAVWFDYNNDGRLDLMVAQFVDYSSLKICGSEESYGGTIKGGEASRKFYCAPRILPPTTSHLYRNEGRGKFTDVSKETGISENAGKGFGLAITDINNDRYMDVFQANDMVPNFLLLNHDGKRFEEIGLPAGTAYGQNGQTRSGMGVDAADFNGDGRQDLFVANIDQELFSLYKNNGDLTFDDMNLQTDIGRSTRLLSGWGVRFLDFDNDGLLDLINANGHPDDMVDERRRGVSWKEPLVLFHNEGNGKLRDVSDASGDVFGKRVCGRGLAVGDLNNDGYPDVVVGVNGGAPLLLINNAESRNNWLGLHLLGVTGNPAAIGAIVKWQAAGKTQSRLVNAGGSFMSSHDPRLILGLAKAEKVDWVEIQWPPPSTRVDRFSSLPINRYLTITEGKGIVSPER